MTAYHILLLVGSAVLLFVAWVIVSCIRFRRQLASIRPRPSFRCPTCGGEQIDVLSSGLWDGVDEAGRGTCGIFEYGVCKSCAGRCARFVDDQPFVPSEQQWQEHFGPMEKRRRQVENWPFEPSDEKNA